MFECHTVVAVPCTWRSRSSILLVHTWEDGVVKEEKHSLGGLVDLLLQFVHGHVCTLHQTTNAFLVYCTSNSPVVKLYLISIQRHHCASSTYHLHFTGHMIRVGHVINNGHFNWLRQGYIFTTVCSYIRENVHQVGSILS